MAHLLMIQGVLYSIYINYRNGSKEIKNKHN